VKQEESEQNEVDGMKKGADSTGKVMLVQFSYPRVFEAPVRAIPSEFRTKK